MFFPLELKVYIALPMRASGNQVAMLGNKQRRMMAMTMHATNGREPIKIVFRGICGAIPFITYRLSPTGGEIKPISILMVNITANQIGSKPAVTMTGNKMGATIKITATGGRKNPAINRNTLISPINNQRLISRLLIHSAIDCVMNKLDNM